MVHNDLGQQLIRVGVKNSKQYCRTVHTRPTLSAAQWTGVCTGTEMRCGCESRRKRNWSAVGLFTFICGSGFAHSVSDRRLRTDDVSALNPEPSCHATTPPVDPVAYNRRSGLNCTSWTQPESHWAEKMWLNKDGEWHKWGGRWLEVVKSFCYTLPKKERICKMDRKGNLHGWGKKRTS